MRTQGPSGGRSKEEQEALRRKAFNKAQQLRKNGDLSPIEELIEKDLKRNGSKYLLELRSKKKKKFDSLIEGK